MKQTLRNPLVRSSAMLVGLAAVGLAGFWSILHPARVSTIVQGRSFSFGTTPPGDYLRHSWTIRNDGSMRLKLRTRFTHGHCGFSLWQGQDHFIPPGSTLVVSLTLPTPGRTDAPYSEYVDVLTNDPELPRVRFRAFGITGHRASTETPIGGFSHSEPQSVR